MLQKFVLLFFFCLLLLPLHPQNISTIAGNGTTAYAGDGGPAVNSSINQATGVAVDRYGNIFIADNKNHRIRKVDIITNIISTIAGNGRPGYNGDDIAATTASLNFPSAIAVDEAGNIFIADTDNSRVRKVDANTQRITTIAGTGAAGFNSDNIPAITALLNGPTDVAIDSTGNILIADRNNHRIRKISSSDNTITTVAGNGNAGNGGDGNNAISANLNSPAAVCLDKQGNIYIADQANNAVRKVDNTTGKISRIAGKYGTAGGGFGGDGGPAINGNLLNPSGLAADSVGNIFIADLYNNAIREIIASDSTITTVAGIGGFFSAGYTGDGGPATAAKLFFPLGVALDKTSNLYIADGYNSRIRKVTYTTPGKFTFKGNGKWSDESNWLNQQKPPAVLIPRSEIIIDPIIKGECLLDFQQTITAGSTITVMDFKKLRITGELRIQ